MKDRGSRIIILTGAPLSISLDWNEEALCAPLQSCFFQGSDESHVLVSTIDTKPAWRSLPLEPNRLSTGLTQASKVNDELHYGEEASCLTTEEISFVSSYSDEESLQASQNSAHSKDDILSQFYEHSFALHEELPSSQVIEQDSSADTSFFTESEHISQLSNGSTNIASCAQAGPFFGHITDLRDVPNASYIRSIEPQTMTVNLVAGIIAMPEPRVIMTRKDRRRVELIEMLVGDETKAGFGINIWLHPYELRTNGSAMQKKMAQFRPQDIVLIKNVALTSFNGKVYGQSLRKNTTTLDLIYRNTVDRDDLRGIYSAQELEARRVEDISITKAVNVKQWVTKFVGAGADLRHPTVQNGARGQSANKGQGIAIPPDTQP